MAITKITGASIAADSIDGTKIADDAINSEHITDGGIDNVHIGDVAATKLTGTIASGRLSASNLGSGTVPTARLGSGTADTTTFLRGDGSWQVVSVPKLDSPVITGTLSVIESSTRTHTISNWSDDVSYTITPTNCTVGSVNASGEFVITHTSGTPSYTILATTASLGLDDSALVTKNLTLITLLSAPTISSPADSTPSTNVVYTITSTDSNDDKLVLDFGASTFTFGSVSVGSASKVGNTVECTGFTTNNPAVTIQFTASATYSVTAKAVKIDGSYADSASSSADSITIAPDLMAATGGTITTDGDYKVHTFTSSGTFAVSLADATLEYLVIGGGGGGSGINSSTPGGGGGGAGAYRTATGFAVTAQSYSVTVGAGGAGGYGGSGGASSIFSSITSDGGGRGSSHVPSTRADTYSGNGSGGGGTLAKDPGPAGTYGYIGGTTNNQGGGGGGGSASAGTQGNTGAPGRGGNGGNGTSSSITGSAVTRAGGGGGGGGYPASSGNVDRGYGGTGGGGNGGGAGNISTSGTNPGLAATANTGSGGGGGGGGNNNPGPHVNVGGAGGSGIVILRYRFQ